MITFDDPSEKWATHCAKFDTNAKKKKYARRKTRQRYMHSLYTHKTRRLRFLKNKPAKKGEQCFAASVKNLRNKTQLARWLADERKDRFATKM